MGPWAADRELRSPRSLVVLDPEKEPASGSVRECCYRLEQLERVVLANARLVLDEQRLVEVEHPVDVGERTTHKAHRD